MRLFIGIALPKNVRRVIADSAEELHKVIPGRYVLGDNYHITLVFIGETDRNNVVGIKRAMEASVIGQKPVELSLGHPRAFGKKDNALLHMTVDGWKQLWDLDNRQRGALKTENIPFDEKPFRAHITLARKARIDTEALKNWPVHECTFCVDEITLFQSTRINGVLTYLPLEKVGFKI